MDYKQVNLVLAKNVSFQINYLTNLICAKMGSEKFSLRWNDFERTISSSLSEIREAEEFLDVTLACGEDQIKAHRLIISACSPLLRKIVTRTAAQANPFIYLKGIKFEDLLACLQFMYQGEVSVAQENLNSFLSAAEELKVRGLTQEARKEDQTPTTAGIGTRPIKEESINKPQLHVPQAIKPEPRDAGEATSGTVMTEYLESEEYQAEDYTDYTDDLDYQLETRDHSDHSASLSKGRLTVIVDSRLLTFTYCRGFQYERGRLGSVCDERRKR